MGRRRCREPETGSARSVSGTRDEGPRFRTRTLRPIWPEKILTSRAALQGESKQVTVLFCDLANSTGMAEQLGAGGHA